jgi:SAM-dependent methyltransferase
MAEHGSDTDERTRAPAWERVETPAELAVRARSFGAVARAYADHRPGYPDAALDWVLGVVSGESRHRATRHSRVLDLGAGTGKLTEALARRPGTEVTAVEPDPEMLAELRVRVPGARALGGTAEDIPLPDESVDAVLVGQAFHWFDREPALGEIARVLRPGGVLGVLANRDDLDVEWVAGYYDSIGWARGAGSSRDVRPFPDHPAFEPVESERFANPVTTTVAGLLATLGTYSWISTLPRQRRRATAERARAYLLARPDLDADGAVELPMVTSAARLVRPPRDEGRR